MDCIIVEDTEWDRELLMSYIGDTEDLNLLAEFDNPSKAKEYLEENVVDLIFCDVMLGENNGLAFIKSLKNRPQVIFTTSFPDFAVVGFELNATDYLVKPYTFDRYTMAVKKAFGKMSSSETQQPVQASKDGHFFIRSEHNLVRINYADVIYIEALKDYIKIVTRDARHMTAMNLKAIGDQLPGDTFVRIHRSFIVNIQKIDSLNNFEVIANGKSLPLGENYKEKFLGQVVNGKMVKR